jgi:hypothetical protein
MQSKWDCYTKNARSVNISAVQTQLAAIRMYQVTTFRRVPFVENIVAWVLIYRFEH